MCLNASIYLSIYKLYIWKDIYVCTTCTYVCIQIYTYVFGYTYVYRHIYALVYHERFTLAWLPSPSDGSSRRKWFAHLIYGGLWCLSNLWKFSWLLHFMPLRASGLGLVVIIFESAAPGARTFSRPVPSALATAHTYRRMCQVHYAPSDRLFCLSVSLIIVLVVLLDGFRLQFILTRLDHSVQNNHLPWAYGDAQVMCLLRRHMEITVKSEFF